MQMAMPARFFQTVDMNSWFENLNDWIVFFIYIYPYYRHCLGILKELWIGYDRMLVLCNGQMIVLD